ncbi:MAG: hypothetical protein HYV03_06510 [Deltaproteobacteria bacterium]|nr:hypothetical protein [Deltaproteobacteria bacterium]
MSRIYMIITLVAALSLFGLACKKGEPPAVPGAPSNIKEHPAEHPHEHPGEGGKPQSRVFSAPEIKAAMQRYVDEATQQGGGAFNIRDLVDQRDLALKLVKIHDPVRQVEGKGYFACADFQATDGTVYDLDVWMQPRGEMLAPTETMIHKVAGRPRFTYQNNEAVPVQ